MRSNETTSFVLSVDGKKVAPGVSDSFGDEDLWGYEKPSSVTDRAERKDSEIRFIENISLNMNTVGEQMGVLNNTTQLVTILSNRIKT